MNNNNDKRFALTGVPETLLWAFWYRASEASKDNPIIIDPIAVETLHKMDHNFQDIFGTPDVTISLRSLYLDTLVKDYLTRFPDAQVIALGEGLETQFWRVDNGHVLWYSVDLPEAIDVRNNYLPSHERNINISCSALDTRWSEYIDSQKPVFISASGLFMYLERQDVISLLNFVTQTFPKMELFFDIVPPFVSFITRQGFQLTPNYQIPHMPFSLMPCDVEKFVEDISGLHLISSSTFTDIFPEHNQWLAFWANFFWLRNQILGSFVHVSSVSE